MGQQVKEFLCDQGNCQEIGDKNRRWITVTIPDSRLRFCSFECLKLWAMQQMNLGLKP